MLLIFLVSGGICRCFVLDTWYARKRKWESTDIIALNFRFIHLKQVNTAECTSIREDITGLN
jgi:hypothetical protein